MYKNEEVNEIINRINNAKRFDEYILNLELRSKVQMYYKKIQEIQQSNITYDEKEDQFYELEDEFAPVIEQTIDSIVNEFDSEQIKVIAKSNNEILIKKVLLNEKYSILERKFFIAEISKLKILENLEDMFSLNTELTLSVIQREQEVMEIQSLAYNDKTCDVNPELFCGPLKITDDEILALKIYQGGGVYLKEKLKYNNSLINSTNAYEMLNVMLFDGIENECTRVIKDRKYLDSNVIKDSLKLLFDTLVNIYSAMYKYSFVMDKDEFSLRVDRPATIDVIKKQNEIPCNFSTSRGSKFLEQFKKDEIVLEILKVSKGTPCIPLAEVLPNYLKSEEEELLIAPGALVEIEEKELTFEDKKIKDANNHIPKGKYVLKVSPKKFEKEMTTEDLELKEKSNKIMNTEEYVLNAVEFLEKLKDCESKEEFYSKVDSMNIEKYIEWKKAFKKSYEYAILEKMMEIDKSFEEYSKRKKYSPEEVKYLDNNQNAVFDALVTSINLEEGEQEYGKEV